MEAQMAVALTDGVALVITHQDGSRTLHVFKESGVLKVPETMVSIQHIAAGTHSQGVSIGGGGAGSPMVGGTAGMPPGSFGYTTIG